MQSTRPSSMRCVVVSSGMSTKDLHNLSQFQSLTDKYLGEVDKVLVDIKKSAGAK